MSKEKLYAVKNDEGKYWELRSLFSSTTNSKEQAKLVADEHGGHVVTLIEEPEKVVLTKEQAKIVEGAHGFYLPARYISINSGEDEEKLLMDAYVNGYTVGKKYLVYKVLVDKQKHEYFAQAYQSTANPGTVSWFLNSKVQSEALAQFTEAEIEYYGLQDCEKVECENDGE